MVVDEQGAWRAESESTPVFARRRRNRCSASSRREAAANARCLELAGEMLALQARQALATAPGAVSRRAALARAMVRTFGRALRELRTRYAELCAAQVAVEQARGTGDAGAEGAARIAAEERFRAAFAGLAALPGERCRGEDGSGPAGRL